jgi:hypothetical protein
MAVSEWAPGTVAFQLAAYGGVVSVDNATPSTKNCTCSTPLPESVASALMLTVPLTVEPAAGAVMDTAGALLSLITLTPALTELPTTSTAMARTS